MKPDKTTPSKTIALCFLVWNEKTGCEIDVPRVDFSGFDEVFALDGGSTDGTHQVFERLDIPVYQQTDRGLNAAYWQAVETAKSDFIVVFFPKGTLDPAILAMFQTLLRDGHDLVIASRQGEAGSNEEDSRIFKPRKWGVKCLAAVASLVWRREGNKIHDVLHGVKGFSRAAFLQMSPGRAGVSIDLEMAVRAYRLHLSRAEFPVVERSRGYGETRFKILPTGIRLARFLLAELRRPAPARAPAAIPLIDGKAHAKLTVSR